MAIMAAWLPKPLRGAVAPVVRTLVPSRLLPAIGMAAPSPVLKASVHVVLKLRALAKRGVAWEAYPTLLAHSRNRSYPGQCYRIDELGPPFAHRPLAESPDQGELEREAQAQVKRAD